MDRILAKALIPFLILCIVTQTTGGQMEGANKEYRRSSHFSDLKAGRCSYTLIVPQQKTTGTHCLSTCFSRPNQSEVASLQLELKRQQDQLEKLQRQLEHDESLATEVRALQKETSSMNSRIAQLYVQLLREVIHKKDVTLEHQRLESLILNATAQALQVSSSYRDLEKKYGELTTMMGSQNQFITKLEKQCQCRDSAQSFQSEQALTENPKSSSNEHSNYSVKATIMTNDVQREQRAPLHQHQAEPAGDQPVSTISFPTELPFVGLPVTKSPDASGPGPWRDCQHVLDSGETTSGIYLLRLQNVNRLLQAWCEQSHAQGGWTVIQRRKDGSVNFFRSWEQYKKGFGNLNGEYWLGLEHVYWLTQQTKYKLRVVLEDWQGRQVFAEYDKFQLEPENDWYRLRLGQYRGNAGDSLSWHNNKAFTTLDLDKDSYAGNCAHYQKGGWWYHMCAHSNLNGMWYQGGYYRSRYQDGVYWAEFHGGSYSLKSVSMMIKPT